MTYNVGQPATAADFTNFRGINPPNTAFANDSVATNKIAALVGVGYGSRGYGQTSVSIPGVNVGDVISVSSWNSLFSTINLLNNHTGVGLNQLSPITNNSNILAVDGSNSRNNIQDMITTLDANRLTSSINQMSLSVVLNDVFNGTWYSSDTHEFTVGFGSEDPARWFFNTGGYIYLSASRTGGTVSLLNASITQLLQNMGTIKFGAESTTYTGSGGVVYPIGYYGLTNSYQTLFVHQGTIVGYTNASYTLQARSENISNTHGGNGNLLRFRATFATGLSSAHTVDGTLTSTVSQLISSGVAPVTPPVFLTTASL